MTEARSDIVVKVTHINACLSLSIVQSQSRANPHRTATAHVFKPRNVEKSELNPQRAQRASGRPVWFGNVILLNIKEQSTTHSQFLTQRFKFIFLYDKRQGN